MENRLKINIVMFLILLQKANLNKKVENYKFKKLQKIFNPYITAGKKIIKFDDAEIKRYKFHKKQKPYFEKRHKY